VHLPKKGTFLVGRVIWKFILCLAVLAVLARADTVLRHLFLCRSPLLAFDFWQELQHIAKQGVTITPAIVEEVCQGMRAGADPQCIRFEADGFKPVGSGWGGALAMSDGTTKIWFHNPDAGGWIHPGHYVNFIN
jgi:hypothetical protein